ncbi:nitroreductase family deazaflavin-dependent oxidoreductase [Streptomonospora sediminis]
MSPVSSFNERVIAEFRANQGRVREAAGFGTNLVLIHSRGAQTGRERVNPALCLTDGAAWLVIGSAKGAPKDPAWVFNLRAHPDAEIEVPGTAAVERIPVTATELAGTDRERAFGRFVGRTSSFAAFQQQAGRTLPIIRFTRRPAA